MPAGPGPLAIFVAPWSLLGGWTRVLGTGSPSQQLGGRRLGAARREATASLHAGEDRGENGFQVPLLQPKHEASCLAPTDLGGFDSTMGGIMPTAQLDEPLLDDHRTELGVHFAQDPPGIVAAPAIYLSILFPLTKQPFDLPSGSKQDQNLFWGEQATGNIG